MRNESETSVERQDGIENEGGSSFRKSLVLSAFKYDLDFRIDKRERKKQEALGASSCERIFTVLLAGCHVGREWARDGFRWAPLPVEISTSNHLEKRIQTGSSPVMSYSKRG